MMHEKNQRAREKNTFSESVVTEILVAFNKQGNHATRDEILGIAACSKHFLLDSRAHSAAFQLTSAGKSTCFAMSVYANMQMQGMQNLH